MCLNPKRNQSKLRSQLKTGLDKPFVYLAARTLGYRVWGANQDLVDLFEIIATKIGCGWVLSTTPVLLVETIFFEIS